MSDPIAQFKTKQREGWASFAPLEMVTTPPAAHLVHHAGIRAGHHVLDVGCGTGVAAITARRLGARVTGLDLTPELLARAKENSALPGFDDITWREGDAEVLPFDDATFDVVMSQYGHMFAPRPEVATKEMLRVLKPGGTIAFSTWPPELGIGRLFALTGRYAGPLPPGVSPTGEWGDTGIVTKRLGSGVRDVLFDRQDMLFPAMSVPHFRVQFAQTSGPILKLVQSLQGDAAKLAQFNAEFESVVTPYFDASQNVVRFGYLLTRATKV